jgi:hypothetical protein
MFFSAPHDGQYYIAERSLRRSKQKEREEGIDGQYQTD